MKEHREPPPDVAEDPRIRRVAPTGPERLALPAPDAAGPRRRAIDRARSPIALLSSVLLVGSCLGYLAIRAAFAWLADQPAYQIPFRDIRLDPPPPPWYRGGAAAFLQDVRRRARMPERFSLLGLKPYELKRAFECSPWTEEVRGITYPPLGVTVRLAYRRPVAVVEISPRERYLIDATAVILPLDPLDRDAEPFSQGSPLLTIKGEGLAGPQDPKPGITWKPRAGTTDLAPGNGRIPSAAKLAEFLREKLQATDLRRHPGLSLRQINPMDEDKAYRGLFLWNNEDKTYVLWGEAPGEEKEAELKAEEKWRRVCAWSRSQMQRTLPDGQFWKIDESGLKADGTMRRPPASTRVIRPPHDRETILTKDPG